MRERVIRKCRSVEVHIAAFETKWHHLQGVECGSGKSLDVSQLGTTNCRRTKTHARIYCRVIEDTSWPTFPKYCSPLWRNENELNSGWLEPEHAALDGTFVFRLWNWNSFKSFAWYSARALLTVCYSTSSGYVGVVIFTFEWVRNGGIILHISVYLTTINLTYRRITTQNDALISLQLVQCV